jgi:WD40 repeat protein
MKLPARVSNLLIYACLMSIIVSPVSAFTEVSFIQQTIKPSSSKPQPAKPLSIQVKESELAKYTDMEQFGMSYRSRDYSYIAYRTKSDNIQVRSLKDPSNDVVLPISGFASCLAFSNDNKRLAVAIEKTAILASIETKETLVTLGYTQDVKSITLLQDNKYAVLESETDAALWNLETNSIDHLFSIEDGIPSHTAVSQDSKYILLYNQNKKVKVWDSGTKAEVADFSLPSWGFIGNFSKDSKYIVLGGQNGIVSIYNLETKTVFKTLQIKDSADNITLKFSDDSKYVAIGGWSGNIKLVDLATGKEVQLYHRDSLVQLAISSDNKYMISASIDGFIKIFDLQIKAQLGRHSIYYLTDEMIFLGSSTVLLFASEAFNGELYAYSLDLYQ